MKKNLLILAATVGLLVSFAVFADVIIDNPLPGNGDVNATFTTIINSIIDFIFYIAIVLAPLMIVVGGFMFLYSGGDTTKVDKGKKIITYSLLGFAVILLAKAFMGVLESTIGFK